jgi:hypothetical protein
MGGAVCVGWAALGGWSKAERRRRARTKKNRATGRSEEEKIPVKWAHCC